MLYLQFFIVCVHVRVVLMLGAEHILIFPINTCWCRVSKPPSPTSKTSRQLFDITGFVAVRFLQNRGACLIFQRYYDVSLWSPDISRLDL